MHGGNYQLYQRIVACINDAISVPDSGCIGSRNGAIKDSSAPQHPVSVSFPVVGGGVINDKGLEHLQQEVCIDVLCGLLLTNDLDYQ